MTDTALVERSRINGEKTKPMPPVEHRFKPGNPGRPKGSRNKLGEAFIEDLHEAWLTQGKTVIANVIEKHPEKFLRVVASVIPQEIHHTVEDHDSLSDDALRAEFLRAAGAIQARIDAGRGDRAQGCIEGSASQLPD